MQHEVKRFAFLDAFTCVGANCEDTCCVGWGMQVDAKRKELYREQAPELLDAITGLSPDAPDTLVMKRDPQSGYCVKFTEGLCGIQKQYGEHFLGDACYFFPRVTRNIGDATLVAATLSCPEIARLTLFGDNPFILKEKTVGRLPANVKNYLPTTLSSDNALNLIYAFLDTAGDNSVTAEQALCRIITVSKSLDNIATTNWYNAIPFLIKTADERLPCPAEELADPYRLLHALAGLIAATPRSKNLRLMQVFSSIEQALSATICWDNLTITTEDTTLSAAMELKGLWDSHHNSEIDAILHRWLQTQLAMSSFPFAGLGNNAYERILFIAIRFATVKLALISHLKLHGQMPDHNQIVVIVQSLARFMDHLSDPTLSLTIYNDAGWTRESRLVALVASY